MVQALYFEEAWERTISVQDRKMIHKNFDRAHHENGEGLMSTYLRHDYNHRGQLLYMVLLHHYEDCAYAFTDKKVSLIDKEGNEVYETFTIPVEIPPYTSMPWTFIFPAPEKSEINVAQASLLL